MKENDDADGTRSVPGFQVEVRTRSVAEFQVEVRTRSVPFIWL